MSIEELVASLSNEQLLALLSALKENETTIEMYDAALDTTAMVTQQQILEQRVSECYRRMEQPSLLTEGK